MTIEAVILLGGVLAAVVFWNPFAGLCLTISSVPIVESLPAIPFATSLTALLGALTLASCLGGYLARRWTLFLPRDRTYGWIIAFGAASLAGLASAPKGNLLQGVYTYAQSVILAWLTGQLATTRRRVEVLMIVWVLTLAITQAIGLAGFDFSVLGRENRLESLARNPNVLAFYSIGASCFALYFLLNSRRTLIRVLLIGAFVLGTLSVLLSASRGGYLVLVAVVLYALLALRFRFVRGLRVGGTLLMIVAALLLASRLNLSFVPGLARGTAQAVAQVATGKSSEARVRIVQHGLRAWAGHPVFGVGLGVGPDVGAYSGNPLRGTASHSTYLTALVETGVVGFVLFCALLLTTWSNLSQRLPAGRASGHRHVELNWAWRAVFLGFLMMSLSGNLIFDKVLWVTIGMSIVFRKRPDILTEPAPERE